jgi:nucleoside-diphosphate-sugar epimerase
MVSEPSALLVTGAGGFIGSHLTRLLRDAHPRTTIVAQHSPRRTPPLVPQPNLSLLPAELKDIGSALSANHLPRRYDGVFHLAAYTPKASGNEDEAAVIESNIVGLRELLAVCEGRVDRFIFASTLDVYGVPTGPISELSPLQPGNLYAASKVFGEVAVRQWGKRTGARTAVFRVGHIYGPGEDAYRKLIPNTIRSLLAGEAAVQYGDGAEKRDFLYVTDAAAAFQEIWQKIANEDAATLNLVSGQSVSVADVIALLGSIAGPQTKIERRTATGRATSFEFDSRRLRDKLSFPRTPLEDGLRAEVEWFRTRMGPCS